MTEYPPRDESKPVDTRTCRLCKQAAPLFAVTGIVGGRAVEFIVCPICDRSRATGPISEAEVP